MKALLSGSGHAPPPKWEYTIYEPRRGSSKESIAAHLCDFGLAGWELVSVVPASLLFGVQVGDGLPVPPEAHFILKRQVIEERPSLKGRLRGMIAGTLGEGALEKLRRFRRAYGTSSSTV